MVPGVVLRPQHPELVPRRGAPRPAVRVRARPKPPPDPRREREQPYSPLPPSPKGADKTAIGETGAFRRERKELFCARACYLNLWCAIEQQYQNRIVARDFVL